MERTKRQQKDHERYLRQREMFLERARQWKKDNPQRAKEIIQKQWDTLKSDPERYARYLNAASNRQRRYKIRVLEHYAGGAPRCVCCGVAEIEFLTLDHIKGGGSTHRKEVGANLYKWAIKNNFPDGLFRILCMNCNLSFGHYGYCPHTDT